MTRRTIKLSLLSITLIAGLTTTLWNLTDDTSIVVTSNIEVTSDAPDLKPTINAKAIITATSLATTNHNQKDNSQNGQLVVMHRPDWKFDDNLIAQFENLRSAAVDGDNKASYILAMNLKYCNNSPVDDTALEKVLAQANEFSDSEIAVTRITVRYEYCSGIEQKHRTQFYSYLQDAANSGYVAAQEVIGSTTAEFFMESQGYANLERDEYITMRDNFIKQKVAFLQRAAQNGSLIAISRLASMNRAQKIGGNGYVKAFGFNQVMLELTQNNDTYNRYSRYQQKLQSQLTSEEINSAFAMSSQWLAEIKVNGTIYLTRN